MEQNQTPPNLPPEEIQELPEEDSSASHNLPLSTLSLSFPSILPSFKPQKPTLSSLMSNVRLPSQISAVSLYSAWRSESKQSKISSKNSSHNISNLSVLSPLRSLRPSDPAGAVAGRRCSIVWFRSDLRLHDNEALAAAAGDSLSLLPVYLFDPRDYGKSSSGFDKTGPYRARFLIDSVAALRGGLRDRGSDLVVRVGRPEIELVELAKAVGADAVYAHREVSHDEVRAEERVEEVMQKEGVEVKYFWGSTLYHIEDLPFGLEEMPSNYGGFREKVKGIGVRKVIETPEEVKGMPARGNVEPGEIPSLQDLGLNPVPVVSQDGKPVMSASLVGGENEALERLKKFAAESCAQPKKNSNDGNHDGIYGANFSCKISPWLASGCLSPRFMFEELKKTATRTISAATSKVNDACGADTGMNWLMFELMWRDFFRFITKKYSSAKKNTNPVPATACVGAMA